MLKDGVHYGYDIPQDIKFNFAEFKKKRDTNIECLNRAYERNWSREKIDLVHGTATFKSPKEIEVSLEDGEKAVYTAPHILIATGGYPIKPQHIPGSELGLTSDDFFDIEDLPKKMAFVGAGYIAVELAGVMNAVSCLFRFIIPFCIMFWGAEDLSRDMSSDSVTISGGETLTPKSFRSESRHICSFGATLF